MVQIGRASGKPGSVDGVLVFWAIGSECPCYAVINNYRQNVLLSSDMFF